MKEFFNLFHHQVKHRFEKFGSLHMIGEDSIRYDFFYTLMKHYKLETSDIILEQAFPSSLDFQKPENNKEPKQGRRGFKPELDLRVDPLGELKQGLLAEFSFFKETQKASNQPRTTKHGKLMNDIFRLALLKSIKSTDADKKENDFSLHRCILVCVSDAEMINYNRKSKNGNSLQMEYELSEKYLEESPLTTQNQIKNHFKTKAQNLGITPVAKQIFYRQEEAQDDLPVWCTWIWEVDYKKS